MRTTCPSCGEEIRGEILPEDFYFESMGDDFGVGIIFTCPKCGAGLSAHGSIPPDAVEETDDE